MMDVLDSPLPETLDRKFPMPVQKVVAALLLAALLGLTVWVWFLAKQTNDKRLQDYFNFRVEIQQSAIAQRMMEYQSVLSAGAGLFVASDKVEREQWHSFVDGLQLDHFFPGVQAFGIAKVVRRADLSSYIAMVRSTGFSDYTVKPAGEREVYVPVMYVEPFSGLNMRVFGYDLSSEPIRKAALDFARDTQTVTMSGKLRLLQETERDVQNGFLMVLPTYTPGMPTGTVQERRLALDKYVCFAFRINDLMSEVVAPVSAGIGVEIYDGDTPSQEALFYSSEMLDNSRYGAAKFTPLFSKLVPYVFGNHVWTLHFYALPGFGNVGEINAPVIIAVAGTITDFLIFILVLVLFRRQEKIQLQAETMTQELRIKTADIGQFNEILAHHLQEPVRLQLGYATRLEQFLIKDQLETEPQQALNYIKQSANRLRLLLRDVQLYLALSQFRWIPQPCDANQALQDALGRLDVKIAETQASIGVSELPRVMINPQRLVDVLTALIDNSISHNRKDIPPIVRIWALPRQDDVVFIVEDNGVGIPKEYHERVFNVFERLSPESSPPGTGIGLAIVKKIIESAHGAVWIETSSAGGTRVLFSLLKAEGKE